uniref:Dolichol kinase n=1 Tax=Gongylonema pulchrum TaxID=637853 RepID=A0A183DLF1_9BILA
LPLIMFRYVSKSSDSGKHAWTDLLLRHLLLLFALVEGLLAGYVLSERAIDCTPPIAALTPIAIGVGAQVLQPMIKE